MHTLADIVRRLIDLRSQGQAQITLLAICPNSRAVLAAAVKVAAENDYPLLLAATLNQVDTDGGYTGWTPASFVAELDSLAATYRYTGPVYPCLDHGGPWLKDAHTAAGLSTAQAMAAVKSSISACVAAGYNLLHIDPTVDRTLPAGSPLPIDLVVARTVELIQHADAEVRRLAMPPISYEVGTEEVHGGLADLSSFTRFVTLLHHELAARDLAQAWPCFIVGKVGTDLHTSFFDAATAAALTQQVVPFGSLIKGHYTDGVDNPAMYPASGMGAANVGPEFTIAECEALAGLCRQEDALSLASPSHFERELAGAVVRSGRWRKWLQPAEHGLPFDKLAASRRTWLVQTGARYVWTDPSVMAARRLLYDNLRPYAGDPDGLVIDRIAQVIGKYVTAFNLQGANRVLCPD